MASRVLVVALLGVVFTAAFMVGFVYLGAWGFLIVAAAVVLAMVLLT